MKFIIGLASGLALAFLLWFGHRGYHATAQTQASIIPTNVADFLQAWAMGKIKLMQPNDPAGIYSPDGLKVGYIDATGSVYDVAGNLILKGVNLGAYKAK